MQADRTATLNEHEAIKERERIFARTRRATPNATPASPSGVKIYEITVKNADKPGLVEYKPDEDADTTISASSQPVDAGAVLSAGASKPHAIDQPVDLGAAGAVSTPSSGANITMQTTSTATTNAVKSTVAEKKIAAAV